MTRSALSLALLALFLLQGNAEPARERSEEVKPYDAFSDAEVLLDRLRTTVHDAIQESLPVLSLLPNQLNALGTAVVVPAEVEIQVIYDHLIRRVHQIEQKAESDGKDISACIRTYQYELDILPRYVLNEIIACVNASVQAGDDIVRRSIEEIRNTENVVLRLSLQLEECKIIGQASCVQPVLESIEIQLIDLPARIKEDTVITRNVVRALEADLHYCSSDKVDIVETIGQEIIDYIQRCVDES